MLGPATTYLLLVPTGTVTTSTAGVPNTAYDPIPVEGERVEQLSAAEMKVGADVGITATAVATASLELDVPDDSIVRVAGVHRWLDGDWDVAAIRLTHHHQRLLLSRRSR